VLVIEAESAAGGGARSAELTLPGYVHDVCSAIHPLALASPFFQSVPLAEHGVEWIHPLSPLAHPLDDGQAAVLERSFEETGRTLGADARAYRRLMEPLVTHAEALFFETLGPFRIPRHPLMLASFGLRAVRSARGLANTWFQEPRAKALFAGMAAHSILPLDTMLTAAVGLMLGVAGHAVGWPVPRGGSGQITAALVQHLQSLGGEVVTNWRVQSHTELPPARAYLFDTAPKHLGRICGELLPHRYARSWSGSARPRRHFARCWPERFECDVLAGGEPLPQTAAGSAPRQSGALSSAHSGASAAARNRR